ncbi:MAG: AzlD domain-containing protein [Actinobacteria bacterium]|nr:AzlD domain-containing protein [Actinomycetota bacterium]
MSWIFVLTLAATAYGFKVLGLVLVGERRLPGVLDRCLALIPAALIAALVMKDTFSVGQHLQIDARAAGVGAAVIAAWRRAPLIVVIIVGAAVTAALRVVS